MGDEKYAKALDKLIDARDEIARLRAELAEAREAVKPFAALADSCGEDDCAPGDWVAFSAFVVDVRRARAFIDRGA